MYAIVIDLKPDAIFATEDVLISKDAYSEVGKILTGYGFDQKGKNSGLYLGNSGVNAVTSILATQALSQNLSWFSASVRDIRMLRIEEENDLGPAIGR